MWEYRQIDLNDLPRKTHEVDVLNELGEQGWELVGIMDNQVAYLKRRRDDGIGRAKAARRSVG
jgi:hypothetical protein